MTNPGGPQDDGMNRNMILAIVVSLAIFLPYNFLVLEPMQKQQRAAVIAERAAVQKARVEGPVAAATGPVERGVAVATGKRVKFDAPGVDGSIALDGGRIDDLSLKRYRQTVDPTSPEVVFLNPEAARGATYGVFGWTDSEGTIDIIPTWTAPEGASLTPQTPLTMTYATGDGLTFTRTVAVDDNYVFTISDTVANASATPRSLRAYGAVRRHGLPDDLMNYMTVHEGFTGVLDGTLYETDYKAADKGKGQNADKLLAGVPSTGGWLGITDKYWLAAVIPERSTAVSGRYTARRGADGRTVYEAGYIGEPLTVAANGEAKSTHHFFAGAKRVEILRNYEASLGATDFTKAVDWGNFYFLTRPFFWLLENFYKMVGNFGLAIMLTTIVVKALLFPVAYNSYKTMSKMQKLQPKMKEMQERYAADQQRLQQEMIKLYQTEKINPVTGCLPIFLQIPIFYALYKVLLVTIEMRHAPFVGYIKDLSAPDPTSWLNLFGILPFDAPVNIPVLGFILAVGLLPILYGVSMWAVTAISPQQVADPMQRRIFQLMPIMFTFMFASFAVGMVVYWVWSNTLTFTQQYLIMRHQGVETGLDKWLAKIFKKPPSSPVAG
ncbi:MAG: preprotein translocase subunit YidC [Alphaproteobacteria bacterium]|nr:MAG: preprotein translocase subunit YidC [Caulobacteraceae bacterium]TPW05927.1 MAG: preprotein translocase subunit YidC [Alphaproteobacteria bacterium]